MRSIGQAQPFDMAVLYGAAYGQSGAGAGGTEAGRVDRDQAVGVAPGADLGGPAMARIARDYGYTLAELRKL
jgi:hypothetical protein